MNRIIVLFTAAFWGAFIGTIIVGNLNYILVLLIGICTCALFWWSYYICSNKKAKEKNNLLSKDIASDEEDKGGFDFQKCLDRIELVLLMRKHAADRLQKNEFWMQTINIYYSCFTSILSICSLQDSARFLALPSVIFTITVAILVIYTSAQHYGARARDLRTNCIDIELSYYECCNLINSDQNNKEEEIKIIMGRFLRQQEDSEYPAAVDGWKYLVSVNNEIKYTIYIIMKLSTIFVLVVIPLLFVFVFSDNFVMIFTK